MTLQDSLILTRRFLNTMHREKGVNSMLTLCFLSIALGTFSLTLVAAIMNGFEKITHKKLQGIHTDVIMKSYHKAPLAYEKIKQIIAHEFSDTITSITPMTTRQAIVQNQHSNDFSHVVMIQAIDHETDGHTRTLIDTIVPPTSLIQGCKDNSVLIGSTLAESLNLKQGDSITLLYPSEQQTKNYKVNFDHEELTVGAFFKTGIVDFDATGLFCSYTTFKKIFPDSGIDEIGIKIKQGTSHKTIIDRLKNRFNLDVFSWHDLYPALISALILEKYAMLAILALITLVASMNMSALLLMYILQKQGTIAILMAMGTSARTMKKIFTMVGLSIASAAGTVGFIGAAAISWILESYQLIQLPDIYYTSYLPAHITLDIALIVFVIIVSVSLCATWFATRGIETMPLAQILKFQK